MKSTYCLKHGLLFVILLFGSSFQLKAQEPPPKPIPTPHQWQQFESADGGFRVQFPVAPKIGLVPFTKGPVTFMRHTHEVGWSGYFLEVDYWDISTDSQDPDLAAEGGIAGMIRAMEAKGGRLLSKQKIANNNCPGREAVVAIPSSSQKQGFAVGRVFVSGLRAYTLVFVSMTDDQASRSISEKFFSSFSVMRSCSTASATTPTAAPTKVAIPGTGDPSTGWRRIESTEYGFSVLMPGEAHLETQTTQTKPFVVTHRTFAHENNRAMFSVEVLGEYPASFHNSLESMKTLLDITAYSMKRNLEPAGFVVVPLSELRLGKFPGQEFELKLGATGNGRAQIFVTAKRVYILVSVSLSPKAPASDVEKFFASVKITP